MMKKLRFALPVLLLALVALLAVGCKADSTVSAADCMKSFADDLNVGNFDLGTYTHSEATDHYLALNKTFWETNFMGDGTFAYTMSGDTANATEAGVSFVFTLEEDGKDTYAIKTIVRNGTTVFE